MLTPITDTYGNLLLPSTEPHPGSIVMTDGEWGTAWQRHFSTGNWHPTRGTGSKPWAYLLKRRNLVLVYAASPRPERGVVTQAPRPMSARALGIDHIEVHGATTGRMEYHAPPNADDAIIRELERKNRTATGRTPGQPEPQWGRGEV